MEAVSFTIGLRGAGARVVPPSLRVLRERRPEGRVALERSGLRPSPALAHVPRAPVRGARGGPARTALCVPGRTSAPPSATRRRHLPGRRCLPSSLCERGGVAAGIPDRQSVGAGTSRCWPRLGWSVPLVNALAHIERGGGAPRLQPRARHVADPCSCRSACGCCGCCCRACWRPTQVPLLFLAGGPGASPCSSAPAPRPAPTDSSERRRSSPSTA